MAGKCKVSAPKKMRLASLSVYRTSYFETASTLSMRAAVRMNWPVRFCTADFSYVHTMSCAVSSLPKGLRTFRFSLKV